MRLCPASLTEPIAPVSNLDYAYSNLPTQPVGPDDLLALSVYDSPELTRTVRVDANGNIRLPMLKTRFRCGAWFRPRWETAIARSLTQGKVLVDPIVTVTIVEYQSRPVKRGGGRQESVGLSGHAPHSLAGRDRAGGRNERRRRLRYCRSAERSCRMGNRPGSPKLYPCEN